MTPDDLKARVADLSDDVRKTLEATLPSSLVRKQVSDYTGEEIAAVSAQIDAIEAGQNRAIDEHAKAEEENPTIDLDDLPSMIESRRLRERLGKANSPELNQAWVDAHLGALPDLMYPEHYMRAEAICAAHEPSVLSGEAAYSILRDAADDVWTRARDLRPEVRGRTLYLLKTEALYPNPVPLTDGRVNQGQQILAEAIEAEKQLPAPLPPEASSEVPPAPTPPEGTIDEVMAWVEADADNLAMRAAVARSHELVGKKRKRLLSKLDAIAGPAEAKRERPEITATVTTVTIEQVPDEGESTRAPGSQSAEPDEPPASDVPSPEPEEVDGGDCTASTVDPSGDIDWAAVGAELNHLEMALKALRRTLEEMLP